MRMLKIDLSELEVAFESNRDLVTFYLDTDTGEVIPITDDERDLLNHIYETYYDEESQTVDWEHVFENERVPDWQRAPLQFADQVTADIGGRFVAVPWEESRTEYRDMEDFIETVHHPRLQERLERAISGRGAFRNFKDILLDNPAERERWFQFKRARLHQRALEWLEELEMIPMQGPE